MTLEFPKQIVRVGGGAGWLARENLVLTCAHLVGPVGETGPVYFGEKPVDAEVVHRDDPFDIAVLRLRAPVTVAPAGWELAPGAEGDACAVPGFPEGEPDGAWAYGEIAPAKDGRGYVSLDPAGSNKRFPMAGFSGGPYLYDVKKKTANGAPLLCVLGMQSDKFAADGEKAVYGAPADRLFAALDAVEPTTIERLIALVDRLADPEIPTVGSNNPRVRKKEELRLQRIKDAALEAERWPQAGRRELAVQGRCIRLLSEKETERANGALGGVGLSALGFALGSVVEAFAGEPAQPTANSIENPWFDLDSERGALIDACIKEIGAARRQLEETPPEPAARTRARAYLNEVEHSLTTEDLDLGQLQKLRRDLVALRKELEAMPLLRAAIERCVVAIELAAAKLPLAHKDVFRDAPHLPAMVMIDPVDKSFWIGSPDDDPEARKSEKPRKKVTLGHRFAIGLYPVTFAEFDRFCEETGRSRPRDFDWGRELRPVVDVDHSAAEAFALWCGDGYRLPSEVEWEFACRAGTTTRFSCRDALTASDANFGGNVGKTTEVGSYDPNDWGLFDMHGNVWEWTSTAWRDTYEHLDEAGEFSRSGSEEMKVLRGGSWYGGARLCRSATRYGVAPGFRGDYAGFRLARTVLPRKG